MKIIAMDDKGDLHVTRINPSYYDLSNKRIDEKIMKKIIRKFFNDKRIIEISENIFIKDKSEDGNVFDENEIIECFEIKIKDDIILIESKFVVLNDKMYETLFEYQSKKITENLL